MDQVTITGWDDIRKRWADAPAKAQNSVRYGFGRYITFLIQYMRKFKLSGQVLGKYQGAYDLSRGQSRWQKRPGGLKRSLSGEMVGELQANITGLFYGGAWDQGFHRREYFVRPRIAKALTWHVGGNVWAFSKGHRIPAQTFAARPWTQPSYVETFKQRLAMVVLPLKNVIMTGSPAGDANPYFKNFGRGE